MAKRKKRDKSTSGDSGQNAAVDVAATAGKLTGGVVTAAAIGLVKGVGKAIGRSFKRGT